MSIANDITFTPYLLDPISKIAFRIAIVEGRIKIYGKAKGGKEHWVPSDDHYFERAEMLDAYISEEEYENY